MHRAGAARADEIDEACMSEKMLPIIAWPIDKKEHFKNFHHPN